jgi:hypothetical protein
MIAVTRNVKIDASGYTLRVANPDPCHGADLDAST